jgi:CheY-like chemotaxis protein
MTLLYIDDDPEDKEFFQEAVRQLDPSIQCYTAKDGLEGMTALEEMMVRPDYIFVDMNMPVMNGRQFLLEIKQKIRVRSIPVVIYTTTAHPGDQETFQELGAFKVLVKPNSMQEIARLVNSVIREETSSSMEKSILAG